MLNSSQGKSFDNGNRSGHRIGPTRTATVEPAIGETDIYEKRIKPDEARKELPELAASTQTVLRRQIASVVQAAQVAPVCAIYGPYTQHGVAPGSPSREAAPKGNSARRWHAR